MDRKCTALVGEALRLIAALSRSKDETEIRAAENRDAPWNWRMRRNRVRSLDSAGRARAMTIRIAVRVLAILAVGPNARTRGVGCRTQTYKVPSADDGGERAVNVVRC